MFDEKPYITENFQSVKKTNPVSGHGWTEKGKLLYYTVRGGGWLPTNHRTIKGASRELALRNQILKEREERS